MATYYWVGGDGTWDNANTTNWSNASGGASGFGPPTSSDTAIFDSSSGTGICTTAATASVSDVTLNSSTLGLTLGASLSMGGNFTLTAGTLSLASYTLTCYVFSSSNANTRAIAFGSGNITITANATTIWNIGIATGFSYTGTPVVNCIYAGATGTRTITNCTSGVRSTTQSVSFNITAGTDIVTVGTSYCFNLNFTGFSGTWSNTATRLAGSLVVSSSMTVTAGASIVYFDAIVGSGTQKITTNGKTLDFPIYVGTGATNPTFQLQDNCTIGSTRTFLLSSGTLDLNNLTLSTGIFSSSGTDTRSIAFGTGNITLTGNNATVCSFATVTNFSYTGTPTVNLTYAGSTGIRTIAFGSTSGATELNSLNFNILSGSDSISISTVGRVKSLDFTGFSGILLNRTIICFGSLTLSNTMTIEASTNVISFNATSGIQQITTNGVTVDKPITFNGIGGTFAFQDGLTQGSTRAFTVTNGTVQLKNGVTSTVGAFATSGTTQKFLQSTTPGSQATLSQASGTVNASYLTIQDINATGGAEWDAFTNQNNIDAGNNDGWDFGISPVVGGAEYTYSMRSFTQPRRF
jgi:hypothetical protein